MSEPRPISDRTEADMQGPPFDRDAESALLGSCLIDRNAFDEAALIIGAADFYLHQHRAIWTAIKAIYDRDESVDELTIEVQLRDLGELQNIGGMAYIIQLLTTTPTSANADSYAQIVKRGSVRRQMINMGSLFAQLAGAVELDTPEILDRAEGIFARTSEWIGMGRQNYFQIVDVVADLYEECTEAGRPDYIAPIVPSGFPELDKLLGGGFKKQRLTTVAARPGMGKSVMLLNCASNICAGSEAAEPKGVAFFTLEMSKEQYGARLMSSLANIPHEVLESRQLKNEDYAAYVKAAGAMSNWRMIIDETQRVNPFYIKRKLKRWIDEFGIEIAFIDYLQLMSCGYPNIDRDNDVQKLSIITQMLKEFTNELKIPIVTAAQLNRNVEGRADKRPGLADLKGSGSIEQDSDTVIFIYRDEVYHVDGPIGGAEWIVEKNRHGRTGTVSTFFQGKYARFTPAEVKHVSLDVWSDK